MKEKEERRKMGRYKKIEEQRRKREGEKRNLVERVEKKK